MVLHVGCRAGHDGSGGEVIVMVADLMRVARDGGEDGGDEDESGGGDGGTTEVAGTNRRKSSPEKFSGGDAGQWRLPEIGEEGERELGLCVFLL
ncbi:hypothetical protein Tco_0881980 [Tanacetum coccineum]